MKRVNAIVVSNSITFFGYYFFHFFFEIYSAFYVVLIFLYGVEQRRLQENAKM